MNSLLAMAGGVPVRAEFLPFAKPSIGSEEIDEVVDTLKSGWISRGPKTERFERLFADYCGARHAVAVNSCTSALHMALAAIGVRSGDEVITSPVTFPSTVNVILHLGARPVFADVEPGTLNIDAESIEKKVTRRTKALLPVHFAGMPCDLDRITAIAKSHGLSVIEDAAHAFGAEYKGTRIGGFDTLAAFSFYATKNITTGEGGMLTTQGDEMYDRLRPLSLHGMTAGAWKRYADKSEFHWDIVDAGFKYNMSDIQAALGIHQLEKAEKFWQRRKAVVERYNEAFRKLGDSVYPIGISPPANRKSAYHLYVLVLRTETLGVDRDTVARALLAENIGIGIHFRALHLFPYYSERLGVKRGTLPNAEYASDRVLSLPLYPALTDAEVEDVISAVVKVVQNYRKRA